MTPPRSCSAPRGYTLVEVLVATTLTLMMMAGVVQIFGLVGESVSDSRSALEMNDRLRAATNRLQLDLAGITAPTLPPVRMSEDPGYFEYYEGPLFSTTVSSIAVDAYSNVDQTVTDFDDVVMFTTRSSDQPFIGRWYDPTTSTQKLIESRVAEVCWFVRGGNLYRRVLLVVPGLPVRNVRAGFYAQNDISVRYDGTRVVANSLGDLTRRENRYAHPTGAFPFSVAGWGKYGLPTLGETSNSSWNVGVTSATASGGWSTTDFWTNPQPQEAALGSGSRVLEDVVLSNVIGFDVKAWDPKAPARDSAGNVITGAYGAYVDLGGTGDTSFSGSYDARSGLTRTYDTWTDYYETSTAASTQVNGFDDGGNGVVDDASEGVRAAPYAVPLRGIQIKIRVFEPDSRQIREVTVVQDFMPK